MFSKVFPRAVKASFHGCNAGVESFRNLGVASTFLHECQQGSILRPQLRQRVTQRIELLGVDRAGRLGNVFMLLTER